MENQEEAEMNEVGMNERMNPGLNWLLITWAKITTNANVKVIKITSHAERGESFMFCRTGYYNNLVKKTWNVSLIWNMR